MDWSNSQFDDPNSFDAIQRFFENNPVGSIGAKLLSSSNTTTTATLPNHHSSSSSSDKNHQNQMSNHHHHHHNPSSPDSIPSPCSSLNQSTNHQTQSNPITTSHPKRKTSPASSSSSALKDRKEHNSSKKSSTGNLSDPSSNVEHTHEIGSEPSDHHHHEIKGVGKLKRKEQNRNAQRAFRERKERRLQELQDQVDELLAKQEPLTTENKHLKELVNRLQTENQSLGVYKEVFTFTIANDLRRSSMPISTSFDQPQSMTSSSLDQSGLESSSSLKNGFHTGHPLKAMMNRGNQENLNRLGLSLPTSGAPDPVLQKPPLAQHTPRNSISGNGTTHEGYTPPLSSSSSLASFLNTNHTPVEAFNEDHQSYGMNSSNKLSKPVEKFESSFPSYTTSSIPADPMLAYNVHQSDLVGHPEPIDHSSMNPLSTFTSNELIPSTLDFNELLPLNQPRQISASEPDQAFWNSYLNFESSNDSLVSTDDEKIKPNAFETFNHQDTSFLEMSSKDLGVSRLSSMKEIPDLFQQWRSTGSGSDSAALVLGTENLQHHQQFGLGLGKPNPLIQVGLSKFVDRGVLSNLELDGLCEMLESKATCKEKREMMNDVVAIRPDWIELIEDITRKARSRCTEGGKEIGLKDVGLEEEDQCKIGEV
ncbi:uncharacterized protein MELLADRAFT_92181 [Melampsora larici-populina 98AG31]|uniref:BZIP domain-containing protein n=1 Tax=Melampsora larici-populina (strain 98AG31 / pathotype 3-4-7) TaxID=747676 RepID=F4S1T4_MELLP|nr:uncharacterized protein MELLADRAFT_92181 [Melampsora larici-populina 98AG31]EGG01448.1 hypothetical protein MELLADRAFT_92181 [Melampsora larici-populina 98AG31]